MTTPRRDTPGLSIPPPVIYAVPLALTLWAQHLHPEPFLPPRLFNEYVVRYTGPM